MNHFFLFFAKIIASANYMLSELFQLDEPKKEDSAEFPINGNSDESYSEEEEEMPDSDENGSYSNSSDPPDDNKAVAIIKSVGELSVPEKYKSVHRIRVSDTGEYWKLFLDDWVHGTKVSSEIQFPGGFAFRLTRVGKETLHELLIKSEVFEFYGRAGFV